MEEEDAEGLGGGADGLRASGVVVLRRTAGSGEAVPSE